MVPYILSEAQHYPVKFLGFLSTLSCLLKIYIQIAFREMFHYFPKISDFLFIVFNVCDFF